MTMNLDNQDIYESDIETDTETNDEYNSDTDDDSDVGTVFEIELEKMYDKYDDIHSALFDDYFDFLHKTGHSSDELEYFDDDIRDLYLEQCNKLTDLLKVNCETYEHFIDILITLEDYIWDCLFYSDEMKHNEYIELATYRINFMDKTNNSIK